MLHRVEKEVEKGKCCQVDTPHTEIQKSSNRIEKICFGCNIISQLETTV